MYLIRFLGRNTLLAIQRLGEIFIFLATAIFWTFVPPFKVRRLIKQIHFIGVNSIFIVLLTGLFTGMVLGLQGFYALRKFGADALLGPTVALSLIRELGPVLSALMVTGRAGSALAAEIGIMRISEQIDAMEVMALNPYRYLVVPNLVAGVLAFPVLATLFDFVGIFGGYLIGVQLLGISPGGYFGEMKNYIEMKDILGGFYKSLSFGLIVAWVSSYKGYTAGYGAEGVSKATTQAVVLCSVLILIWDYFITSVYF
ncbi:MAG: ABC transporter permease [Candidatus Tectomicrobia bacterium]|uniref:ABC transporter permease n=1 Tax=Tectimicrobiota bacterium TaxID=2528274 RepID=A0A932CMH8_UNCTE|nr:ABC transporter permease [Candidatus Tectomicrobia bacterium]